jgi:transposase
VWLVIEAVARLDTSAFHRGRKTGGAGAAGYDPDMLLAVLIWAYANGVTSSRRIERLCQQDVAFRVICAGHLPDHVTIARFRAGCAGAAAPLFAQVLVLCARLGMGQVGTVAIDGTKIGADAAKDANRTEDGLRRLAREMAAAHAKTDAAEDALFGKGRHGDDDPGDPSTRRERVAAALASLEEERRARQAAERAAAQQHLEAVAAGSPPPGRAPAGAEVAAAEARVAREIAAYEDKCRVRQEAAGPGRRGRRPVPAAQYCRVRQAQAQLDRAVARAAARLDAGPAGGGKDPAPVRNVTDPASRLMPVRGGGFIQGYNAQNVTSEDGLVIATRLTGSPADTRLYEPVIAEAQAAAAAMAAAGGPGTGEIGLVLADAGYLSLHNLTCPGPDRLIATGSRRDLGKNARQAQDGGPPGPWKDPAITAMTARLATPDGTAAYRRRSHIGETFHGDLKHNQHIRRLSVRGPRKTAAEWTFITAVRNLRKAITSGHLTPAALAALPG